MKAYSLNLLSICLQQIVLILLILCEVVNQHIILYSSYFLQFKMEKHLKIQQYANEIKRSLWNIFIAEYDPSPYLTLLLLYFSCLQILPMRNYTYILLVSSIFGLIALKRSYFFLYGIGINKLGLNWITGLNMLIGLYSCNQKWKIYIYIIVLGDFIQGYAEHFKILIYLIICIEILLNFSFKKSDNLIYFTSCLSLAINLGFKNVMKSMDISTLYLLVLIPIEYIVFAQIFKIFQQMLMEKNKQSIYKPETADYYIWVTMKRFAQIKHRYYLLQQHQRQCCNPTCFCYTQEKNTFDKLFEENLYISFLQGYENRRGQWQFLYNQYIKFKLLERKYFQGMILNHTLIPIPENIFRQVQRSRNQQLLKQGLKNREAIQYDSNVTFQGLEYDSYYYEIKHQIISILQKKISFFMQLGKSVSNLQILSDTGRAIVIEMQTLHEFFQRKVIPIQEKINSFMVLILYLAYLSSTTSFKDEIEFLLKNAEKKIKEIELLESKEHEIQTALLELKKQHNRDKIQNTLYQTKISQNYQIAFKKVSKALCQMLNLSQKQIIGQNINLLIPQLFHKFHEQQINNILSDKNIDENSKLNGKFQSIPITIENNQGIIIQMNIKFFLGNDSKLQFISLMNPPVKGSLIVITDFDRKVHFYETSLNPKIVQNQTIIKKIAEKKQQWENCKKIKQENFIIKYEDTKYIVKLYCPTEQKESECQICCIYLSFQEELGELANNAYSKGFKQVDAYIRGLMVQVEKDDQSVQSTTENKMTASTSIIAAFLNKKILPFFYSYLTPLALTFVLLLTFSTLLLNVSSSDSPENTQKLIADFETSVSIQQKINQRLLLLNNLKWSKQGFINTTFMEKIYGKVDINEYISSRLTKAYVELQDIIYKKINGDFDPNIETIVKEIMNEMIHIKLSEGQLNLSTNNLLVNCILDFSLIPQGTVDPMSDNVTIFNFYLHDVRPKLIEIRQQLLQYFKQTKTSRLIANIIMLVLFSIILILLIIPFIMFRKKYSKYRLNIFDLIVSIETKLLQDQVSKLMTIITQIKPKYGQNEELKVMDTQKILSSGNLYHSKQVKIENFNNQLRKRSGQIDLVGSQEQSCKMIWKKYVIVLLILALLPLFVSTITIKITFEDQLYSNIEKINIQHYLYRIAEDSAAMFNELYSKKLKNLQFDNQDINKTLKQGLDTLVQFNNLKQQRPLDNRFYECDSALQNQFICIFPNRQSTLIAIISSLIQQAANQIQNKDDISTKNVASMLFYLQTVLRQLQEILIKKSLELKEDIKDKLQATSNYLILLYSMEVLVCFLIGLYGLYYFFKARKQQIEELSIMSLLNLQMIISNKRIQSYLQKMSKA